MPGPTGDASAGNTDGFKCNACRRVGFDSTPQIHLVSAFRTPRRRRPRATPSVGLSGTRGPPLRQAPRPFFPRGRRDGCGLQDAGPRPIGAFSRTGAYRLHIPALSKSPYTSVHVSSSIHNNVDLLLHLMIVVVKICMSQNCRASLPYELARFYGDKMTQTGLKTTLSPLTVSPQTFPSGGPVAKNHTF
jgi:hypothetical protein